MFNVWKNTFVNNFKKVICPGLLNMYCWWRGSISTSHKLKTIFVLNFEQNIWLRGRFESPTVYNRVFQYRDWINRDIGFCLKTIKLHFLINNICVCDAGYKGDEILNARKMVRLLFHYKKLTYPVTFTIHHLKVKFDN